MKLVSLIFLLHFSTKLFAQNQTVTTGGTANGSGGSVTYTIGLPLYTNQNTTSVIILQGTQQPYEFLTVSYRNHQPNIGIKVFPNPAESYFYIQTNAMQGSLWSYKLSAVDGKFLSEEKFTESTTMVNIKEYAEGIYMLQVYKKDELVFSTKIIKINR